MMKAVQLKLSTDDQINIDEIRQADREIINQKSPIQTLSSIHLQKSSPNLNINREVLNRYDR